MTQPTPDCPACRIRMQEGYVLDSSDKGRLLSTKWVEGQPEKSFFSGHRLKGKLQIETITFRCPKCGWLIWFAPSREKQE